MRKGRLNSDPPDLRPIGARALKSAIDTLRPWLHDSDVLDLFSGQGRFGIATLEEGAKSVTFVEKDQSAIKALQLSTQRNYPRVQVVKDEVLHFLRQAVSSPLRYDIVFADPPFRLWNETFTHNLQSEIFPLLRPTSIFLVKHPARVVPSPPLQGLAFWKETPFGESRLLYFRTKSEETKR